MSEATIKIDVVRAWVSDRRCSDPDHPPHRLGAEAFWCVTCNEYAEQCLAVDEAVGDAAATLGVK